MSGTRRKARLVAGYRHGRVPRTERREQLLDAALGLFAKQGYEGTSIEDVARAAAITRPILYDHFDSKEAMYLACLSRAREAYYQGQVATVGKSGPDPLARLAAGIRFFFEYVNSDPLSWMVLFGGGAPLSGKLGEKAMSMRFETISHISQMMQQAAPTAPPEVVESVAHYVSGGSVYLAIWWLRHPEVSLDDIVARQLAVTWGGLGQFAAKKSK
jgi:AcrR family transcriptional regulator